jgi:hypothetical protein
MEVSFRCESDAFTQGSDVALKIGLRDQPENRLIMRFLGAWRRLATVELVKSGPL